MSKHTPGPWNIYFNSQDNLIIRKMFSDKQESHVIAYCHSGAANARLIAAAPELLAALEMSLKEMEKDWMRLDGEFGPYMQEFGDIEGAIRKKHITTKTIRIVRDVITKAKGEVK